MRHNAPDKHNVRCVGPPVCNSQVCARKKLKGEANEEVGFGFWALVNLGPRYSLIPCVRMADHWKIRP